MHKQVSGWTVNFCPNSRESPFLVWNQKAPPPPENEKLQIWDDQSLLRNAPPPKGKNFRFEMTKVYSRMPPLPPKKEKLQIWDDQSLLRNAPPKGKTSDLRWPKFTPECPPPQGKTSDLRWPKFTPECPPQTGKLKFCLFLAPPLYSCNLGDRMWRLICNPQGYHSFEYVWKWIRSVAAGIAASKLHLSLCTEATLVLHLCRWYCPNKRNQRLHRVFICSLLRV